MTHVECPECGTALPPTSFAAGGGHFCRACFGGWFARVLHGDWREHPRPVRGPAPAIDRESVAVGGVELAAGLGRARGGAAPVAAAPGLDDLPGIGMVAESGPFDPYVITPDLR